MFLFITTIVTATSYAVHEDLKVDHITLIGKQKNHDVKGIEILKHRNLFLIDTESTEEVITTQNPPLKSVQLDKSYPNKLQIKLSYHKPLTYLAVDEGHLLLASDGRVLEKVRDLDEDTRVYPVMSYYQSFPYITYQAGEYVDIQDIRTTLHVLEEAQRIGLDISKVDLQSFHMIVLKGQSITVFFSAEKEKEIISAEMKKIIKQLTLEGTQFRALNLRFERPVIEYY